MRNEQGRTQGVAPLKYKVLLRFVTATIRPNAYPLIAAPKRSADKTPLLPRLFRGTPPS
jgi:hypothetical protein